MLERLLTISAACGLLFLGMTPLAAQPVDCEPDAPITLVMESDSQFETEDFYPALSHDGRYVVFARHIVDGEAGSLQHTTAIYRYDRLNCQVELASIGVDGQPIIGNNGVTSAVSSDGRYIVFEGHTGDDYNSLFMRDMELNTTVEIVPAGAGTDAKMPSISADGRYVVYTAYSSDSDDGVFVYDRLLDESTEVVSGGHTEEDYVNYLATISADGQYIAFYSNADDLVVGDTDQGGDTFLYERATQNRTRISTGAPPNIPSISADGRYVAFYAFDHDLIPDDTNNARDVFVYDRLTGGVERVSVASDGSEGNADSSDDVSGLSADGRYVVFTSIATNLVPHDTNNDYDVFIRDRESGQTVRVSLDAEGRQIDGAAAPAISGDGRFVVFGSRTALLAPGNENGQIRLFLTDWQQLPEAPPDVPQRNAYTTATPTLTWSPITWAAAYEIQIDDDDDFSSPVYHSATLTAAEVITPELPNGVYYWRVRAQRPNGTWGGWSAVDSFVVDVP